MVRLLEPVDGSCVLYLPFWEGVGAFTEDISRTKAHGTITNASWIDGVLGKALDFNGASAYVTTSSFAMTGTILTISIWVNLDTVVGLKQIIGSADDYTTNGYLNIYANGTSMWVGYYAGGFQNFEFANYFTAGVWTHLAIVQDFTALKIYVYKNGSLFNSGDMVAGAVFPAWNHSKIVGAYLPTGPAWFDGYIDEIRIFNRALSAPEIFEEYYRGVRGFY